jgi:hypothetical protein
MTIIVTYCTYRHLSRRLWTVWHLTRHSKTAFLQIYIHDMFRSWISLSPQIRPSRRVDAFDLPRPIFRVGGWVRICRFSINFLRFSRFFSKECRLNITAHPLRAFAPSREPLAPSRRVARPDWSHAKAQRREDYYACAVSFLLFWQGACIHRFSLNFLRFLPFFERRFGA